MKFLCLVYLEPENLDALSPDQMASLGGDSEAYDDELLKGGHYVVSSALDPVSTARTVRVRGGQAMVTDGPFAETKEHLGGFILVDAANMDEAVELAKGAPMAKVGSLEVRPLMAVGAARPGREKLRAVWLERLNPRAGTSAVKP